MDMDTNDFDFENRIMNTSYNAEDSDVDLSLRPKCLDEYIGSWTNLVIGWMKKAEKFGDFDYKE